MGQHYLPQYYLKGFTSASDTSVLWVYEKGSQRRFSTTVKQVANENRYWSDKAESWLTDNVEAPAIPVFEKIRCREKLTVPDKAILSTYLVTMLKRVPASKEDVARWLRDKRNTEPIVNTVVARLEQLKGEHPESGEVIDMTIAELEHIRNGLPNESEIRDVWEYTLHPLMTEDSILALGTMSWSFLIYDREPVFLTCDNPVFYFRDEGIGRPNAELSFPVDKHTVLWACRRSDWREDYVRPTKKLIHEINRRTASSAVRYVFAATDEEWITRLINRKTLILRKYR